MAQSLPADKALVYPNTGGPILSKLFFNDLDDEVECTISKSVDDTKPERVSF